jgi:hypothetical protein
MKKETVVIEDFVYAQIGIVIHQNGLLRVKIRMR